MQKWVPGAAVPGCPGIPLVFQGSRSPGHRPTPGCHESDSYQTRVLLVPTQCYRRSTPRGLAPAPHQPSSTPNNPATRSPGRLGFHYTPKPRHAHGTALRSNVEFPYGQSFEKRVDSTRGGRSTRKVIPAVAFFCPLISQMRVSRNFVHGYIDTETQCQLEGSQYLEIPPPRTSRPIII
jgi:hypothetical protein